MAAEEELTPTTGRAFDGSGNASKRLVKEPTRSQIWSLLGYEPYPGSLNLRLAEPWPLPKPRLRIHAPVDFDFWPGLINGTRCHFMRPGKRGWPSSVEVVAPVHLRSVLGISSGDEVTIEARLDIAIITTVWGGYSQFLPRWVSSIAAQELLPEEVVVLDTGDEVNPEVLTPLWNVGVKATVYEADHRGMGEARNLAADLTDATWLVHMDADDSLLPHYVRDVAALAPEADVVSVGCFMGNTQRLFEPWDSGPIPSHPLSYSGSAFRRKFWERAPWITANDFVESVFWVGLAKQGARFRPTTRAGYVYHRRPDGHNASLTPADRIIAAEQLRMAREG